MKTLLIGLFLVTTTVAAANPPIPLPRTGTLCPSGYHRSNGYCVATSERAKPALPKVGTLCPTGYHRNNGYCLSNK